MKDNDGYRAIDAGLERNIMVFDKDARAGDLTKYVIYHIKRMSPNVTDILVPPEVFLNFIPIDWIPFHEFNTTPELKCFGTNIYYDIRLSRDGIWFDYFNKRDGSLARNDEYLILGFKKHDEKYPYTTFTKDNVILASC